MLEIYLSFFKELQSRKIVFCAWKGRAFLDRQLAGDGDIDLFVPFIHEECFNDVALKMGYRKVLSYQAHHQFIEHYYGYDCDTGKFAHLHVYFKIVTGESASKNYILPISQYLENNILRDGALPLLNPKAARQIFLIRYFLKIGSPYGILQYIREKKKYDAEWLSFGTSCEYSGIDELSLDSEAFQRLDSVYVNGGALQKALVAVQVKRSLKAFRRRGFLSHQAYNLSNFILRMINRFIKKRKKLVLPGIVIAICGLDGTGKSSLVHLLSSHYAEHFSVKVLHLGRPPSTKVTWLFRPLLFFRRITPRVMGRGVALSQQPDCAPNDGVSIPYAIRAVLLAYDRYAASVQAQRWKTEGSIVICDRFPGPVMGKMDSPRIVKNETKGAFYNLLYRVETKLYQSIKPADLLFQLRAPLAVAIERNKNRIKPDKETDDELEMRFVTNTDATFLSLNHINVDAMKSIRDVFLRVSKESWLQGVCGQSD